MLNIQKISTIIFLAIISVAANSSPTLSFRSDSTGVPSGSLFGKAITISGLGDFSGPSLGAFDFDIDFDPSVLRVNRVLINEGSLDSQLDLFDVDHDLGFFSGYSQTSSSVNLYEVSLDLVSDLIALQPSEFILGVVLFDAIGVSGSHSDLTFRVNSFADQDGRSIKNLAVSNGHVRINVVPIPPSLLMFIPGILVILKLQRKK